MTEMIKAASEGITLVGEIMKAAGDNPQVKEAGSNLGEAALTITRTINNALLPLAALNYAVDRARRYFDKDFQTQLKERASHIPLSDIVEPKASIAGPALQGLAFTHDEKSLRDLYLNLLATAMDGRIATSAHPAFVEIIKQLEAEEAVRMQGLLITDNSIPIVQVRRSGPAGNFNVVFDHLMQEFGANNETVLQHPRHRSMVDNWRRLGLIDVSYTTHVADEGSYNWVEPCPDFVALSEKYTKDDRTVTFQKGRIRRTTFGFEFAKATGILPTKLIDGDGAESPD
jgi:hypothetical protein